MQIRNPRTGQYDYTIQCATDTDVQATCAAARTAQKQWRALPIAERIAALQAWKQAVLVHEEFLLQQVTLDTGRWKESVLEVQLVATSIDRWCRIAETFFNDEDEKASSIPFIQLQQSLVPFDVVGVISPWNFPILLSLIDTIPALLAGCAVVVKPSEVTPRFIAVMQHCIADVPALQHVLTYVTGDGNTGAALVQQADLICFTGSTATGRKVYAAAAERMIPVFLELGGKDPVIVTEDVDIERTAASILYGSTVNAGQSCLSVERVYVQHSIKDKLVAALVAKAKQISLNDADLKQGHIGPIIFERQKDIINAQLADAVEKGATIAYGSTACMNSNGGWYCLPTIVTNATHNMLLLQEETFGPIIPIIGFDTDAEAIALANDSKYGLSGAVFCTNVQRAKTIAAQVVGGAISINDCALTAIMHEGEKNSFKQSGIGGTRMGPSAIKRFMRQKVMIKNSLEGNSPWWFNTD